MAEQLAELNKGVGERFAIVSGTLANGYSSSISYPTGYNKNNCALISLEVKMDANTWRNVGVGIFDTSQPTRLFAQIDNDGIKTYCNNANMVDKEYRATLMRYA